MKISVIMPVYLGEYPNCAKFRTVKFHRAIKSFLNQTYEDKELIIISDGCDIAEKEAAEYFKNNIVFKKIDKQPLFSGNVRQAGLELATGAVICYLDSDDFIGENHLNNLSVSFLMENRFSYFNDYLNTEPKQLRTVKLEHGFVGTSNIVHLNTNEFSWKDCDGYGHDWKFISKFIEANKEPEKIYGMEYFVCHLPNILDT